MDYKIEQHADAVTVFFDGEITFTENLAFRKMLNELGELQFSACVLNMQNVSMVDSAGLGMFLIAKERSDQNGWGLSVTGAQGHVASMFKLTKLSELLAG